MSTHHSAVLLTQIKCASGSREKWFQAFQGKETGLPQILKNFTTKARMVLGDSAGELSQNYG